MRRLLTITGVGVATATALVAASGTLEHRDARPATRSSLQRIPAPGVAFEPNVGQSNREVRYLARGRRSTVFLTRRGATFALRRAGREDVLALRFAGANPAPGLAAAGRVPGISNYLTGGDRRGWRTHVPHFAAVRYQGLYPGIGVHFHGAADARLEYDFRVSSGADPSRIRLAFDGVRGLALSASGDLLVHLRGGDLRQPRPLAWQQSGAARRLVPVSYRLSGNTVVFRVAGYDRSRALLIDPKVVYSSYWGGSGGEGCGPKPSPSGDLYVVCGTDSPNLPRVGAIQPSQGQEDAYVARLDRSGRRVVWATYLGSPGQDEGDDLVVNARGEVYVSGFAATGFPTTPGAYDTTVDGTPDCCGGLFGDAFVTKLSADGSRLLYSTVIGGSNAEQAPALALNHDGSVVITGKTGSADFPTTPGAVGPTFHGGTGTFEDVPADAFAAKLNPSGSRLVYSTYLGGSADDSGSGVALDHAGNAYYAGYTASPEFPTTPGALKTSLEPGTLLNGYVTKLDPRGRLKWSTYLGGQGRDSAFGVDVDARRHVYVSGSTEGGFPVTADAAQTNFGGVRDWFVARIDRSGASLDWATYLGGSAYDGSTPTVRVDRHGNADVAGTTTSTDFPTTANAIQAENAGGADLGLVQLDRNGRLRFSSYLGGSGDDDTAAGQTALDKHGTFYVGGVSSSPDFPVTPDAIQGTYGGGDIDGLLVKVAFRRPHGEGRRAGR